MSAPFWPCLFVQLEMLKLDDGNLLQTETSSKRMWRRPAPRVFLPLSPASFPRLLYLNLSTSGFPQQFNYWLDSLIHLTAAWLSVLHCNLCSVSFGGSPSETLVVIRIEKTVASYEDEQD
jgi:hypothetical protein